MKYIAFCLLSVFLIQSPMTFANLEVTNSETVSTNKVDDPKLESILRSICTAGIGFYSGLLGLSMGGPLYAIGGYFGSIFLADFIEYNGIEIWDPHQRTAKCYGRTDIYFPAKGKNQDYSEGLYFDADGNEDFHSDSAKATEAKFQFIFDRLGIAKKVEERRRNYEAAPEVLDAGCGNGAWMDYLRERGVKVVGLTLSKKQAKNVAKKGFLKDKEIFVQDYTVENKDFLGRFDFITALGSTEHLCSSVNIFNAEQASQVCLETLTKTWSHFHKYLKPNGEVYITSLTENEEHQRSFFDYVHMYFLERLFGGYYPSVNLMTKAAKDANFLVRGGLLDFTAHYHWASVINYREGGIWRIDWNQNSHKKLIKIATDFILNPHFSHYWLAYHLRSWIWHLGGVQETPLTREQVKESPARLKYMHLLKMP